MKITVHENHFKSASQAYDEIEVAGKFPMEMDVPAVSNESHWHRFSTWIYVLEGVLNITDTARGKALKAPAGSRVDVPERVLHSEESRGYKIIAGMTADPASLIGPIDLDPSDL
jgi:hypothetical protein